MNVGDFKERYVEDEALLTSTWEAVSESLNRLDMPLFFAPGSHDWYFDRPEANGASVPFSGALIIGPAKRRRLQASRPA